jgi:hypothetical protein
MGLIMTNPWLEAKILQGEKRAMRPLDDTVQLTDTISIYCLGNVYELCCDAALASRLTCLLDSNLEPEHPDYCPF